MSHFKPSKNYTKLLSSLYFTIPGLPRFPRAPDAYANRDLVDVYMAKRRLQLAHRLPVIDVDALHLTHVEESLYQNETLDRHFLTSLVMAGYTNVVEELINLVKEEEPLLRNSFESGRTQSFAEDKPLLEELVKGLIDCIYAYRSDGSDKLSDKVRIRKSLGEKMILLGDFWLARKLFAGTFSFLEFFEDESLDKMRVELSCLLSYVCIYFEDSQQIGYDLPTKFLILAQQICRGKVWCMHKSVMNIFIPKTIYIYGLKNEWTNIKTDWVNMYTVVTTLLHVLCVKKARFWQEALWRLKQKEYDEDFEFLETQRKRLKHNVVEALTSALAYADEIRLNSGFVATTLRRGLFFEEQGEWEKAMEDFNAMHVLALNFDDEEATAMALNRIAQNYKLSGNLEMALERYVQEWEISCEKDHEELQADALIDLGIILLEEGQTWEADECMAQSNAIFRDTKRDDTPNDMDDLTWALTGVTRGQHLWGRYSTLIRTQEKSKVNAIYDWKSSRKGFPVASMPPRWYKTQLCADFEKQYEMAIPKPEQRRKSSVEAPQKKGTVDFFEDIEVEDNTRRLFEFTPKEIQSRPSVWYRDQGFGNMFDFINASDKPRIVPRWSFERTPEWFDDVHETLSDIRMRKENHPDTYTQQRKHEATQKAQRIGRSMRTSMLKARKTLTEKDMADWMKHDFRQSIWKKKPKSVDQWRKMDPSKGVGQRLDALLDDMEYLTNLDKDHDDSNAILLKEDEDESDDTELASQQARKTRKHSSFQAEFQNFDDSKLGF